VYGVCGMEGCVQVGMFEQISYFVYKWTVICECDPFFFFLCGCVENICCALDISLFLRLWIISNGQSIFLAIVSMVFYSCYLACSVIGGVIILCT